MGLTIHVLQKFWVTPVVQVRGSAELPKWPCRFILWRNVYVLYRLS